MPKTDKELALELIDLMETLMVQNSLLMVMLQRSDPKWQQNFRKLFVQNQVAARQELQAHLNQARTRILEAPDLSGVVEQLLKDIPRIDSEQ
ncbi:MAG: hypothetical protein WAN70_08580 [Terriglobales bacterium]